MAAKNIIRFLIVAILIAVLFFSWQLFAKKEPTSQTGGNSEQNNKPLSPLTDIEKPKRSKGNYNLVILSLTNTRKDHLSAYGYERNTSPNIDLLAKDSLVFEDVYAPASWTLPSGISLFTSQFPYKHKVMDRYDGSKINPKAITLAKILKKAGYNTASFNGGGDYNEFFGHKAGYDKYVSYGNYGSISKGIGAASKWLEQNKSNNFFLFMQGFDTHTPYNPPKPYDKLYDPDYEGNIDFSKIYWTFRQTKPYTKNGRLVYKLFTAFGQGGSNNKPKQVEFNEDDIKHMIALYDGEINFVDVKIKQIFEKIKTLGLEKNTIVVVLSEHGDMFGEHGRFMRGGPLRGTFYEPVLNTPLIIKHPDIKPKRVKGLVQIVDVMPTLLDMMNINYDEFSKDFQGNSIYRKTNEYVYAGSQYKAPQGNVFFNGSSKVEVIQSSQWKLIREIIWGSTMEKNGTFLELYDMQNDREESTNLANSQPEIVKNLLKKLDNWSKEARK